jgi:hypothetical protein
MFEQCDASAPARPDALAGRGAASELPGVATARTWKRRACLALIALVVAALAGAAVVVRAHLTGRMAEVGGHDHEVHGDE